MIVNTIINADCLDIMKQIPDNHFDLLLTDPPYGLGDRLTKGGKGNDNIAMKKLYKGKEWDIIPSDEVFKEMFRISKHQVIWGGNYFNLPPTRGFLVWDKNIGNPRNFSHVEMAWTSLDFPAHRLKASIDRKRVHPTQKPQKLMEWCIEYVMKSQKVQTVIDPFMGSGTTALACKAMGLDWLGIEADKEYVDIANKRLGLVQGRLF